MRVIDSIGHAASSALTIAARRARQSDPGYTPPLCWSLADGGKPASLQFFSTHPLDKTNEVREDS